ncbi:hypothetical protein [Nocardia donostiensis]|uniref:Extradiol ring-cleavage dioxygenase class III enzyme subunit B domain-containing protein n=1 Tax=Nocardia donostiensis TaxID=1538463 RepID=A0A1W0BJL7_9NOCA|nr:hypothetical protein [Nocardia donostiensis]ONM47774.1 hypothetical protein B0T46_16145 [Nocardia donostiensis]OQS13706.1 hypothetical protein B0T36_18480 [Nocardia donostiensis]OQS22526.1 hypothetical protein B0T44_05205 [Nocardia donostiensis]
MFCLAALIPSPPILVPELCGDSASERPCTARTQQDEQVAELRTAAVTAGRALAAETMRWTVVGVAAADQRLGPEVVGTFRGYGVDYLVALSGSAGNGAEGPVTVADPRLPLPALIGAWLRGETAQGAEAEAWLIAAEASTDRCAELGAKLRAELESDDEPRGVLVVADGAATLSTSAPGYFDPRAEDVQGRLDRALADGDRAALLELEPDLCAELALSGRAAYQMLAGLFAADPDDPVIDTVYQGAPFGVGYQVGLWRPGAQGGDRR